MKRLLGLRENINLPINDRQKWCWELSQKDIFGLWSPKSPEWFLDCKFVMDFEKWNVQMSGVLAIWSDFQTPSPPNVPAARTPDCWPDLGYPWFTSTLEKAWYTPPPSVPPDLGHYLSQNNVRADRITSPGEISTDCRCCSTPSFPSRRTSESIKATRNTCYSRLTVLLENNDRDSAGFVN